MLISIDLSHDVFFAVTSIFKAVESTSCSLVLLVLWCGRLLRHVTEVLINHYMYMCVCLCICELPPTAAPMSMLCSYGVLANDKCAAVNFIPVNQVYQSEGRQVTHCCVQVD